jgi:hypothetical protein
VTFARPAAAVGATGAHAKAIARVARATERHRAAAPGRSALKASTRTFPIIAPPAHEGLTSAAIGTLKTIIERWDPVTRAWHLVGERDPDIRRATQRRTPWPMTDL